GRDVQFDWAEFLDGVQVGGNELWRRQSLAALERLVPLSADDRPRQHAASFLFGWVIPRLVATGGGFAQHAERIQEALGEGALSRDQRLRQSLRTLGWEGEE